MGTNGANETPQLRQLWRERLYSIASSVAEQTLDHRALANLADHLGHDYHGRFLIELLQNGADQATAARLESTTVRIIRTADLIAVANGGRPMNEEGLRAITALALSPKGVDEQVGNKGVGFKSVYQVCAEPEVYSAAVAAQPGGDAGLAANCATRFSMPADRLSEEVIAGLAEMVADLERDRAGVFAELQTRADEEAVDWQSLLLSEAKRAAPFRFPLELSVERFESRCAALQLDAEGLAGISTLIVLPLRKRVAEVVDRALSELGGTDHAVPGAVIAFLPGVDTLVVEDRSKGTCTTLKRGILESQELAGGVLWQRIQTSVNRVHVAATEHLGDGGETGSAVTVWRTVTRTLGVPAPGENHQAEVEQLRDAARRAKLPAAWHDTRRARVTVALPTPLPVASGEMLGTSGTLAIGLPTVVGTGCPLWIDGQFHGNISRTEVKTASTEPYNHVLLQTAVRLAGRLVEQLKLADDLKERALVTLLFERGEGPLGDALHAPGGVSAGEVVLSWDGQGFLAPSRLALPDAELLDGLPGGLDLLVQSVGHEGLEAVGLTIPHRDLWEGARQVLSDLGVVTAGGLDTRAPWRIRPESDVAKADRPTPRLSLLERVAKAQRAKGDAFWAPFLTWIDGSFSRENLGDQRVLPLTGGSLGCASDRVFLVPVPPATAPVRTATDEAGGVEAEEAGDEEAALSDIPTQVLSHLRFLDPEAVAQRSGLGRGLSNAARQLTDGPASPVKTPALDELINLALAPRLRRAAKSPDEQELAYLLLVQALRWIGTLGASADRISKGALFVPAEGQDGVRWIAAGQAYFGAGWLDDKPIERDLALAYEQRGVLTVPFRDFLRGARLPDSEPVERWRRALHRVGVRMRPRVIRASHSAAPWRAYDYKLWPASARPPYRDGPITPIWQQWVQVFAGMKVEYARNEYSADALWIDGLEEPQGRDAVVRLVLREAAHYARWEETELKPRRRTLVKVESLWRFALRTQWELPIGKAGESMRPDRAWRLEPAQRRRDALELLPTTAPRWDHAADLLRRLGVCTLIEAPRRRALQALCELAGSSHLEGSPRRAETLAAELYAALAAGDASSGETSLPEGTRLPLRRGDRLEAILVEALNEPVYVLDDPIRAGFIPGFGAALSVPVASDRFVGLHATLQGLLGDDVVFLTSAAEVETGFVQAGPDLGLLDWLIDEFGDSLELHMAVLVANEGGRRAEVTRDGGAFQRTWRTLKGARLARGRFQTGDRRAYYDRAAEVLEADDGLTAAEVLAETYLLLGPGYRNAVAVFATMAGEVPPFVRFFRERHVTDARRDQVAAAIGRTDRAQLSDLDSLLFALWRDQHADRDEAAFEAEWEANTGSFLDAARWVACPAIADLRGALGGGDGDAWLSMLAATGLPIARWQAARVARGRSRFVFEGPIQTFERRRDRLGHELRSVAIRAPLSDGFLTRADEFLAEFASTAPPPDLGDTPQNDGAAVAFDMAMRLLSEGGHDRLTHALELAKGDGSAPGARRDANEYEQVGDSTRQERATKVRDVLLSVAKRLAAARGETLDLTVVRDTRRVAALTEPQWANQFAMLAAIREALNKRGLNSTVAGLSRVGAFREIQTETRLCKALGLASSKQGGVPGPKRSVLGVTGTDEELREQLAQGVAGVPGQRLQAMVDQNLDLKTLVGVSRGTVPPKQARRGRPRVARIGRTPVHLDDPRSTVGLIGEAAVFLQLSSSLPDFDQGCWVSENAAAFGCAMTGDSRVGYDFEYVDTEGRLGDMPGRRLLIEVKATVDLEMHQLFVSANEWDVARRCHAPGGLDDPLYVIVCVAGAMSEHARIVDVIADPVACERAGTLRVDREDVRLVLGERE